MLGEPLHDLARLRVTSKLLLAEQLHAVGVDLEDATRRRDQRQLVDIDRMLAQKLRRQTDGAILVASRSAVSDPYTHGGDLTLWPENATGSSWI